MTTRDGAMACEVSHVTKRFGDKAALRDVSISIGAGEIVTLVGPNGAGKTTLVRLIAALARPDEGKILVCGRDTSAPRAVRPLIAIVPQGAIPDPYATPWEHTNLYLQIRGFDKNTAARGAEDALRRFDLWDLRSVRCQELSGGYQRRVLICMALATRPKVLLLDEPSTALDPGAKRQTWNRLAEIRGETSILLTTHDMAEAEQLSDRIALISEGRLIAVDRLDELLDRLPSKEKFVINGDGAPPAIERYGQVDRVVDKYVVYPPDETTRQALVTELLEFGSSFSLEATNLEDVYFRVLGGSGAPGIDAD